MRIGLAAVALGAALGSAGCFTSASDETCRTDRDCGDLVCTRVGECASAGAVYALRVEWTVNGATTDVAGACDPVGDLELAVSDPTTGGQHAVRPVPCIAGSFFFDKLPVGYTEVSVTAYSSGGSYLDSRRATSIGAAGVVRIDLRP